MKTFSEIGSFLKALGFFLFIILMWYGISLRISKFFGSMLLEVLDARTVVVPYLFFLVCFLAPVFFVWKKFSKIDGTKKLMKDLWKEDIGSFFVIYISYIFMCLMLTESFVFFVKDALEIPKEKTDAGYWFLWSILSISPLIWIFDLKISSNEAKASKKAAGDDAKTNKKGNVQSRPLSESEEAEIKRLYRYACQRCHPDKLPPELKKEGEERFKQLNDAYRRGDLARVKEIVLTLVGS